LFRSIGHGVWIPAFAGTTHGEAIIASVAQLSYGAAISQPCRLATRKLGLRPEFQFARLQAWAQACNDAILVERRKVAPFGIYTLVCFERVMPSAA